MATNEKMTNVKALTYVLDSFADEMPTEIREKLERLLETQSKSTGKKKPGKANSAEYVNLRNVIYKGMDFGKNYTTAEIAGIAEISVSKATPVCRTMVNAGMIEKGAEKGRVVYTKLVWTAEADEADESVEE